MNFKRWLKEEKGGGGFGAFLIVIIIAAAIYAVEFGSSNWLYDPEPAFSQADLVSPEDEYERENSEINGGLYTHPSTESAVRESGNSGRSDSDNLDSGNYTDSRPEPEVRSAPADNSKAQITAKAKAKPKAKPKKNRLSREELVKLKLRQGKTVRQIANETGLNRRYIREVKRRNQQVIW